jgi:hypothetical protein
MIVVSDTSAITSLLQIGRVELLVRLYREVVIPEAVERELRHDHPQLPEFIHVAHVTHPEVVERLAREVDLGEAEAIAVTGTTNTCATFSGLPGESDTFFGAARDGVGHSETPRSTADATTRVDRAAGVRLAIARPPLPAGEGELITVAYPVLPDRNYALEYRDSLDEGVPWQELPGAPHNTGSVNETNVLSQRFYRLRVEP